MAEAIVSIVLDQLASITLHRIEKEVSLILGVDGEVENLISHFGAIQAVLQDAEERQVTEANVRNWLGNLEELAYQINDVLDEWNTEILKHQIEKELEKQGENAGLVPQFSKVCFLNLLPSVTNCFCRCSHKAILRRGIAKRITEINEKLTWIAVLRQNYQFKHTKKHSQRLERHKTSSLVNVSTIVGRQVQKDRLMSLLLSESSNQKVRVIPIVGMGGMGKTAFAQLVYNDVESRFDERIWVCVSDPFEETKIAKTIVENLKPKDHQVNSNDFHILLQNIVQFVVGKKILLVLDDVWTPRIDEWNQLKEALGNGNPSSRILVTTRNQKVVMEMGATADHIINLDKLKDNDCFEVFRSIAFSNKKDESRLLDEDTKKRILEKCDGLPLAAKTLASIMQYKKTKKEWIDVLDSKMWELEEVEHKVFQSLLLSYYDLRPIVRRCLLYCAIFPKDYLFKKEELIEFWTYQGYLGIKGDNGKETIIGQTYFDNLVMQSFFQDFSKDVKGNTRCKMHDVVHDFVQFLAKNECVIIEVDRDNKSKFVLDNKVRHLNIKGCSFDSLADSVYNCKRLRTLLASRSLISELSSDVILQWKYLRTLKLGKNQLKEIPKGIGELVHLRYLNLKGNEDLIELPNTVGNLYNLQKLNLNYCGKLTTLPVTVRKLTNLKHLLVDGCDALKLPKEVGRLYNLQTLDGNIPSNASNHKQLKLGDLRKLDQLRGRLWIKFLKSEKDVGEAKAAQLANKKYLSELILEFDIEDERKTIDKEILNALEPHTNLEHLSIDRYGGTTLCPPWMTSLSNLKTVSVKYAPFCKGLGPLGKLPSLERLDVEVMMYGLKTLGVEFLGKESEMEISFPKLKEIKFSSLSVWEEWEEWVGVEGEREPDVSLVTTIMPSLSFFNIRDCPQLKSLPDFLWKTPLKTLIIYLCPKILRGCETKSGAEWDKVSRIPNIAINDQIVQTEDPLNFKRMLLFS